jgi:hypothetical protein
MCAERDEWRLFSATFSAFNFRLVYVDISIENINTYLFEIYTVKFLSHLNIYCCDLRITL